MSEVGVIVGELYMLAVGNALLGLQTFSFLKKTKKTIQIAPFLFNL